MKAGLIKILAGVVLMAACSSHALTMQQLRSMPKLTPQKFSRLFSEFRFEFNADVQDPETFLARETGDCDDFAILAAAVFAERGYHPRLFSIRMNNTTHVVCYFPETKSYIDYNDRGLLFNTTSSDGTLADIGRRVAHTFGADWSSVTEFNFVDGQKELVSRVERHGGVSIAAR